MKARCGPSAARPSSSPTPVARRQQSRHRSPRRLLQLVPDRRPAGSGYASSAATSMGWSSEASIVVIDLATSEAEPPFRCPRSRWVIDRPVEISQTETAVVDAEPGGGLGRGPGPHRARRRGRGHRSRPRDRCVSRPSLWAGRIRRLRRAGRVVEQTRSRIWATGGPLHSAPTGALCSSAPRSGDLKSPRTWLTTSVPAGLTAIDTVDWRVVATLDAPISKIALSPRWRPAPRNRLSRHPGSTYTYESSSYFLIDAASLEVISNVRPTDPTSGGFGPFSFGPGTDLAYVTSWSEQSQIDVLELGTGNLTQHHPGKGALGAGPGRDPRSASFRLTIRPGRPTGSSHRGMRRRRRFGGQTGQDGNDHQPDDHPGNGRESGSPARAW